MAKILDTDFSTTTFRERDVRKDPIQQYAMDCPVSSRIPKGPMPLSSTPEWVVKIFATASTAGVIEGAAPTSSDAESNLSNKTLLLGRFQKSRRFIQVSEEAKLMAQQYAVQGNVFEDNKRDKGLEINVDIEATILSDNESVPPVADTTASTTRSIPRWVSNGNGRFTDTNTTPTAAYRTPTASIVPSKANVTDVTEQNLRDILVSVATARKRDATSFVLACQPTMREQLAGFSFVDKTSSSTQQPLRRWNGKEGFLGAWVNNYRSDFGPVELLTSYQMNSGVHFLLMDMEMLEIGYAKAPTFEMLPPDGANLRGKWEAIWLLKVLNPQAFGKAIVSANR